MLQGRCAHSVNDLSKKCFKRVVYRIVNCVSIAHAFKQRMLFLYGSRKILKAEFQSLAKYE